MPQPLDAIRGSGRHFDVGYLSAMAAASRHKFNSVRGMIGGMMLAGVTGDLVIEGAEAVTITGLLHNGWGNVPDVLKANQWEWNNTYDGIAAIAAASYGTTRELVFRRKQTSPAAIAS